MIPVGIERKADRERGVLDEWLTFLPTPQTVCEDHGFQTTRCSEHIVNADFRVRVKIVVIIFIESRCAFEEERDSATRCVSLAAYQFVTS